MLHCPSGKKREVDERGYFGPDEVKKRRRFMRFSLHGYQCVGQPFDLSSPRPPSRGPATLSAAPEEAGPRLGGRGDEPLEWLGESLEEAGHFALKKSESKAAKNLVRQMTASAKMPSNSGIMIHREIVM